MTTTATVTRTAKGLHITLPDGTTYSPGGKGALNARAIVIGEWHSQFGGGWAVTIHSTLDAAQKAKGSRIARGSQSHVQVIPL